jgi:hypothetical protein
MMLLACIARAHDARPLSITLVEQSRGVYRVVVRMPPSLSPSQMAGIEWPRECEQHDGSNFDVPTSAGFEPAQMPGRTCESDDTDRLADLQPIYFDADPPGDAVRNLVDERIGA